VLVKKEALRKKRGGVAKKAKRDMMRLGGLPPRRKNSEKEEGTGWGPGCFGRASAERMVIFAKVLIMEGGGKLKSISESFQEAGGKRLVAIT